MSNPSAPSIPTSPQPGKDPPLESNSPPNPNPKSTSPNPPAISPQPSSTSQESASQERDKTKSSMPPPPIRPTITTQPPSRSTTFHPSNINSHNLHSTSQTSTYHLEETETEEKHRPPFSPFFTLIKDINSKEGESSTHHPSRIHYIFSDDDAGEVLGGALLRTLPLPSSQNQNQSPGEIERERDPSTTTSSNSSIGLKKEKPKALKPEPEPEKEERIIIVDINESGDGIQRISSLSKNWQVTNASISNAPTWEEGNGEHPTGGGAGGGLMLRIEGVSIPSHSSSPSPSPYTSATHTAKGKEKDVGGGLGIAAGVGGLGGGGSGSGVSEPNTVSEEEMTTLLEGFDRKMAVLRSVVGQHSDPHPGPGHRREGSGGSGTSTTRQGGGGGESAVS